MRIPMLATGMLASCLCMAAIGADYVLDVSRLDVIQGKPKSLKTESIEIGIRPGVDFHTRVRIRDEMVTIKGRLTEDKSGKLVLTVSVQYLSEVADAEALTGTEGETSCSTTISVVAGVPMSLGGIVSTTDNVTRHLLVVGSLDRVPESKQKDTDRRIRIKDQHRKLVRDNLKAKKTLK